MTRVDALPAFSKPIPASSMVEAPEVPEIMTPWSSVKGPPRKDRFWEDLALRTYQPRSVRVAVAECADLLHRVVAPGIPCSVGREADRGHVRV